MKPEVMTRVLGFLWPDTIVTRTIAVLLAGLVIFHLASMWAYQIGINSEIDVTNEARLAERLFSIKRAIERRPLPEREELAHSLSGGALECRAPHDRTGTPRAGPCGSS